MASFIKADSAPLGLEGLAIAPATIATAVTPPTSAPVDGSRPVKPPTTLAIGFRAALTPAKTPMASTIRSLIHCFARAVQLMHGSSSQFGLSPNGSEKLTGSPPAYPYRLSPPASPIGSSWVH